MRWFVVDKKAAQAPTTGTYKQWKPQLREEAQLQCVYCAIHESSFGGERNFHVEHFKPKSRFRRLTNSYANLFYSCAICNTFKSNQWAGEPGPKLTEPAFIDPSKIDYSEIFSVDTQGMLDSGKIAGRYMVERLYLNRPQLIQERRTFAGIAALEAARVRLHTLVDRALSNKVTPKKKQLIREAVNLLNDIAKLHAEAKQIAPYEPADVSR